MVTVDLKTGMPDYRLWSRKKLRRTREVLKKMHCTNLVALHIDHITRELDNRKRAAGK